jgi:hypothetical protein
MGLLLDAKSRSSGDGVSRGQRFTSDTGGRRIGAIPVTSISVKAGAVIYGRNGFTPSLWTKVIC